MKKQFFLVCIINSSERMQAERISVRICEMFTWKWLNLFTEDLMRSVGSRENEIESENYDESRERALESRENNVVWMKFIRRR